MGRRRGWCVTGVSRTWWIKVFVGCSVVVVCARDDMTPRGWMMIAGSRWSSGWISHGRFIVITTRWWIVVRRSTCIIWPWRTRVVRRSIVVAWRITSRCLVIASSWMSVTLVIV